MDLNKVKNHPGFIAFSGTNVNTAKSETQSGAELEKKKDVSSDTSKYNSN